MWLPCTLWALCCKRVAAPPRMAGATRPERNRRLLSSVSGSKGCSPSHPEGNGKMIQIQKHKKMYITKWQLGGDILSPAELTGRLLSCSRSPRIWTRAGKVGLSLGSPCQQASMMPYLPAEGSGVTTSTTHSIFHLQMSSYIVPERCN